MLLVLLLSCRGASSGLGTYADSAALPYVEPGEPGPYDVGVATHRFIDGRGKELTVEVWYPAVAQDGAPDPYEPIEIAGEAHRDAAPAGPGPFPLLAFSHGLGGIRYQSIFLTEHLATHGFVVVSPDHPGSTLLDLDPDLAAQVLLERPDDVRSAVDDAFRRSDEGEGALAGLLDPSAGYGMLGHSFGAITTLVLAGGEPDYEGILTYCEDHDALACSFVDDPASLVPADHGTSDPRVVAAVPMSPGLPYAFQLDGSGLAPVSDVLVLAGDKDEVLPYETEVLPVFDALGTPKALATFADAGHYAFSDICRLVAGLFPDCAGPDEGWLDIGQAQQTTRVLVTAFAKVHVAGDERYLDALEPDGLDAFDELTWTASE